MTPEEQRHRALMILAILGVLALLALIGHVSPPS
jgi:hypothetical protein